jgi:hypothetical protein
MSDGPRRGPYAIANGLAIAAKNAAVSLRPGAAGILGRNQPNRRA